VSRACDRSIDPVGTIPPPVVGLHRIMDTPEAILPDTWGYLVFITLVHQAFGGQESTYQYPVFSDSLPSIGRARRVHLRTGPIDRGNDLLEKAQIRIEHQHG
jgi:hypothetical protein